MLCNRQTCFLVLHYHYDSYVECENKISGEKFHRKKFMWTADKKLNWALANSTPYSSSVQGGVVMFLRMWVASSLLDLFSVTSLY